MATGIRTISCKLAAGPHQAQHIDATLKVFADACNYIAEWGGEHQVSAQFKLHKGTYYDVREHFGLDIGHWQREQLAGHKPTSAVLCRKNGAKGDPSYYLDIQIKEKLPPERETRTTLGIDRGVKNIATTAVLGSSDGTNYGSETLNAY